MGRRTAATHGDAGAMKLMADSGAMYPQLRADLAQGPVLGVQFRGTLNVHGVTVAASRLEVASCTTEWRHREVSGDVEVGNQLGRNGDER